MMRNLAKTAHDGAPAYLRGVSCGIAVSRPLGPQSRKRCFSNNAVELACMQHAHDMECARPEENAMVRTHVAHRIAHLQLPSGLKRRILATCSCDIAMDRPLTILWRCAHAGIETPEREWQHDARLRDIAKVQLQARRPRNRATLRVPRQRRCATPASEAATLCTCVAEAV